MASRAGGTHPAEALMPFHANEITRANDQPERGIHSARFGKIPCAMICLTAGRNGLRHFMIRPLSRPPDSAIQSKCRILSAIPYCKKSGHGDFLDMQDRHIQFVQPIE
jgi:hypothetical protein